MAKCRHKTENTIIQKEKVKVKKYVAYLVQYFFFAFPPAIRIYPTNRGPATTFSSHPHRNALGRPTTVPPSYSSYLESSIYNLAPISQTNKHTSAYTQNIAQQFGLRFLRYKNYKLSTNYMDNYNNHKQRTRNLGGNQTICRL